MPRPLFHERGIACGTTCDKVPKAKMDTLKDLIIISHSYCFIFNENGMQVKLLLKGRYGRSGRSFPVDHLRSCRFLDQLAVWAGPGLIIALITLYPNK